MKTGDASGVAATQVSSAIRTQINSQTSAFASIKRTLYSLNLDGTTNAKSVTGIDWDPTRGSVYLNNLDNSANYSVLPNNWSYSNGAASTAAQALALVGTVPGGTARYAAFGNNPMATRGNAAMDSFVANTISWLTRRTSFSTFKVVVAQLSSGAEASTRSWLAATYPGLTINGVSTNPASQSDNGCDNAKLAGCLQGADLLVIGQDQGSGYDGATVMQAVSTAQSQGIPVLYTHSGWSTGDLGQRLLGSMRMSTNTDSGNYYSWYGLKAFSPGALPSVPGNLADILALVNRLENGGFTTTWSGCVNDTGRVSCSGDAAYMAEFGTPADAIRNQMRTFDAQGKAIFASTSYLVEKMLVLLGDTYRRDVSYAPTFKKENDTLTFLRAYFSDIASYQTRAYTSLAKNLGNFSGMFPANTSTMTKTVTVTPPVSGSTDYATGLYVLPGRSVTITRTDSGTTPVSFVINMLRDTTRVFQQFDRPTVLSSPRAKLAAGQSISVTNPYGGPLYLTLGAGSGQPAVSVTVSGVITHPVLRDATDATQVARFTDEVNTTPTNWVVVATEMLTLHSTLGHFKTSIANYGGDLAKLVAATWTYTVKDTYELAGFNAASGKFSLTTKVANFCTAKGWDCTGTQHRRDVMQHVISDEWAYCGGGCAGNPYDQDWAFNPAGWGETHEIGHNLQRERLKIFSGISTEVSNNIFPMHKHIHLNQDLGSQVYVDRATIGSGYADCANTKQSVAKCIFTIMKTAQGQAAPGTYVYNAIWSDSSYAANNSPRVLFYRQLVEYARYYNGSALGDGWSLYTLMYLLDRNFSNSSANWSSVASSYGFGTYSSYPSSMNGNDFMVIATSNIIGRDMRPVFDLWGITYSSEASAQVAAYGYAAAAKLMFPMSSLSVSSASVGAPVVVTSTATYPAGY